MLRISSTRFRKLSSNVRTSGIGTISPNIETISSKQIVLKLACDYLPYPSRKSSCISSLKRMMQTRKVELVLILRRPHSPLLELNRCYSMARRLMLRDFNSSEGDKNLNFFKYSFYEINAWHWEVWDSLSWQFWEACSNSQHPYFQGNKADVVFSL